jgi:hypothetical protein
MHAAAIAELLCACVIYVGAQRRLLDTIRDDTTGQVALAMAAELGQLTAAVQRAQREISRPERGDPGS